MSRNPAIEVLNLNKSYDVPSAAATTEGRFSLPHPLARRGRGSRIDALRDVSFEIEKGEFFGVVGRNGSGKSTLLKILASVYAADSGRVRIAGRLAPFLELGVGFDAQLAARDNVVMNGVMMGLTPAEARHRADAIIDFAGLSAYPDLRLKNYSSGMRVRLGFAVMVHVDADILLVDEVLAVGDMAFQERCDATFREMHREGRTIVLVTHAMTSVNTYCDRALLLEQGEIASIGDPGEVTKQYALANLHHLAQTDEGLDPVQARMLAAFEDPAGEIAGVRMLGADDRETASVRHGEELAIEVRVNFLKEVEQPGLMYWLRTPGGQLIAHGSDSLAPRSSAAPGREVTLRLRLSNPLSPGKYLVTCAISHMENGEPQPAAVAELVDFTVEGEEVEELVSIDHQLSLAEGGEGDRSLHT